MFLDEELEKIHKEHKDNSVECLNMLIRAMAARLKELTDPDIFLTTLKQIDNSWRLFAKRNKGINPNTWREFIKYHDKNGEIIKVLNW